jgi:uncharacterized protein YqjF (DUF2071 family)
LDGKAPGVWFFSLDAANPFACAVARRFFALNYREATMSVKRDGDKIAYNSTRWRAPRASNKVECELGDNLGHAEPGTLEFFLAERYLLYSYRRGQLFSGQVYHPPYPLRQVRAFKHHGDLIHANGLETRPFTHALFSEGVDVVADRIQGV